jgi:hypothetical protein
MSYDIQNRSELFNLLMKCQSGEMTCLRAMEYIEPQVEAIVSRKESLEGVINAVDRVLWSQGAIHASRAVALVKLISAYDIGKGIIAQAALDDIKSPPNSQKKL